VTSPVRPLSTRPLAACTLGCSLLASACVTVSYDPSAFPRVVADTGLSGTGVDGEHHCLMGRSPPGASYVDAVQCMYVETPSGGALITYDRGNRRYSIAYRIDGDTAGIALKQSQIQVKDGRGYVVFWLYDDKKRITEAYRRLGILGIPEVPGRAYVPYR
jgi:hypothetical protein